MTLSPVDLTAALTSIRPTVRQATEQLTHAKQCSEALAAMGETIKQHQDDILEANTLDLEISRDMAVPELVVDWLKLTPERVQTVSDIFHRLAMVDSGAWTTGARDDYYSRPVGVVGFIYEAFPDLGAIAAALCIRTGNAIILRGGSEASRTNEIIANLLKKTLTEVGLPENLIWRVEPTDSSRLEMTQCPEIDLIIPHGRPSLVEQVIQTSSVPVLPSRMGNCYLYWSASGNVEQVYNMIVSSHAGTPDAVNRIEKVLLHESLSENTVTRLWNRLQENGFELTVDKDITLNSDSLGNTEPLDWGSAYLKRKVAFRQVKNTTEAIQWINTHSSGHADSIATAEYSKSRRFVARCRSASVYVNTSPQFVRNAKQAVDIAVGTSDRKGSVGGLIGLSCLRERQRIFHGDA